MLDVEYIHSMLHEFVQLLTLPSLRFQRERLS